MNAGDRDQPLARRLARAEHQLVELIEKNADGMVVIDADGIVRFANPAAVELLGRDAPTLEGSPFGHPLVTDEANAVDLRRADGTTVAAEMRTVEITWHDEPAYLATLRDVTARRELERERAARLRAQVARSEAERTAHRLALLAQVGGALSSSLDAESMTRELADLLVGSLADWCVVGLTPGCRPLHQAPVAVLAGHHGVAERGAALSTVAELFAHADHGPGKALKSERTVIENGPGDERSAEILDPLGYRSALHVPLRNAAGEDAWVCGVLTVARTRPAPFDRDERLLTEEIARLLTLSLENARLLADARQATELRDRFLATIAHEMRAPLQAITSWVKLLESGPLSKEQQRRGLRVIRENARAQSRLVEDMVDTSRVLSGTLSIERRRLDLREVATAVVEAQHPRAEAVGVHLEVLPGETPVPVEGDPQRLRQVIGNLVTNGLKFTHAGGRVTVAVEARDGAGILTVTDTGEGIEPELLSRLFEPFAQGRSGRGGDGLGLGLAIVRNLVARHGGRVNVDSEGLGHGAQLTIELPLASEEPRSDDAGVSTTRGRHRP